MSASGLYGPTRVAAGIVGTANLRLGKAVGEVLDAQIAAGGGRFRGIRRSAAWDADEAVPKHRTSPPQGLFGQADFRAGFAELAPRGLTFEAWCYHRQIPDVTALARAFPDTTIILNHFGGPSASGIRRPGPRGAAECFITELATCPNVAARWINMEVNGFGWHSGPAALEPGADGGDAALLDFPSEIRRRPCMFESAFP
jgi:predicted TIM-barrel fold metal-dependent hydrolase